MKPYRSSKFSARVSPPLLVTVALLLLAAFGIGPAAADNDRKHDRGRGHGSDQRHEQNNNRFSDSHRHREWRGQDRNYGYRPVYPQPYLYSSRSMCRRRSITRLRRFIMHRLRPIIMLRRRPITRRRLIRVMAITGGLAFRSISGSEARRNLRAYVHADFAQPA